MANSIQNFVTNNVNVESDKVIKFVNPFKNHQQHQIEDFSLFLSESKKCRCCFNKLINDSDQHTVESWHRQAFLALTGVEMMTPDSENFLCLNCVEILRIFTELGKSAANLQKKYNILMQDLASDIKTETDETNEISGRLQDYSDIVISDNESFENDQTMQPQQTNSFETIQNEIIHDENISTEENILTVESSARVHKCTVRLTRIDPETIDKYEYYSIVGNTEKQIIDQISSTSAKSETNEQKDSETSHNRPRLSCDLCGKSLSTKQSIRQHMQTYHMHFKFRCHLCSAEFESSAKLLNHKKLLHRKNFKCEECDAAFGKACLLSEHIKAMHKEKRWYCHYQECSSSFSLKSYSTKHFWKFHSLQGEEMINIYLKTEKNDQSKTKCRICGLIAKNRTDLYAHFRKTHSNTVRFSCDLCGTTFLHKHKMELINHMYTHQMKDKFSCSLCSAEFQSNLKLTLHEKNAHNKKFQCESCDVSFKELHRFKEHVKVQHEGKLYQCQVQGCLKSYLSINVARSHLLTNHSLREEEYRKYSAKLNSRVESEREIDSNCQICGKITKNRTAMRKHISFVHNKNILCDFCGKTFSEKRYVIDHMQTYHMNLKFDCDLCSLELRTEIKLRKHKRVTHNKSFKCDKCCFAFGIPFLLKKHIKVKHEGKRYHCSYQGCSVSFTRKDKATKHLIVAHSLMGDNFIKFNEKLTLQ